VQLSRTNGFWACRENAVLPQTPALTTQDRRHQTVEARGTLTERLAAVKQATPDRHAHWSFSRTLGVLQGSIQLVCRLRILLCDG
jgi:hypothetical protein